MARFIKNRKNMPEESRPVINRTGKIGRMGDPAAADPSVSASMDVKAERNVTISDGTFEKDNFGREKKRARKTHTVKEKSKTPFPVMAVIFGVVCTALFMSVIVNFVQLNEMSKDISDMQKTVERNNKAASDLQAELNEKDGIDALRTYLKEHEDELGMVEEGQMRPPVAVTPKKSETIDDFDAEEVDDNIMVTALNALADNLLNAWNIFTSNE